MAATDRFLQVPSCSSVCRAMNLSNRLGVKATPCSTAHTRWGRTSAAGSKRGGNHDTRISHTVVCDRVKLRSKGP